MKFFVIKSSRGGYSNAAGTRYAVTEVKPGMVALGPGVQEADNLDAALTARGLVAATAPVKRTVERTKLQVREWMASKGKEAQYDTLLDSLDDADAKRFRDASAISWDYPAVVKIRNNPQALGLLGMTEAELRECFEE